MQEQVPLQGKDAKKEEEQCKVEDHITKRFELHEFKGKGAYGVVWKASDKLTSQVVALKKVFDAFHNSTDAQRTFREVVFLEQLTKHDNIIKLQNVIRAENDKDIYMVFEYMETDLHKVIRAGILEPIHKKYIIYQCLKAILYLHSGDLVHRDLKPANLLVDTQCKIKLADFGLARSLNCIENEGDIVMTEYVATRWYRSPEILLGSQKYSKSVDMWSIGCILGEMIIGKAIFPGTSTLNQLEKIIELIGRPKPEDIEAIQAPLLNNVFQNINTQKKKSFASYFPNAPDDAIDFIRKCFQYNPNTRMTVEEAIIHPFVKEFSHTEPEPRRDIPIQTIINDNKKYSVKDYRTSLYLHLNQPRKQFQKTILIRNHQRYESEIKVQDKHEDKPPIQADNPLLRAGSTKQLTAKKSENDNKLPSTQNSQEEQEQRKVHHQLARMLSKQQSRTKFSYAQFQTSNLDIQNSTPQNLGSKFLFPTTTINNRSTIEKKMRQTLQAINPMIQTNKISNASNASNLSKGSSINTPSIKNHLKSKSQLSGLLEKQQSPKQFLLKSTANYDRLLQTTKIQKRK